MEFAGAFVVLVGVVGEYISEFTRAKNKPWKDTLAKASTLVLIAGLAVEIFGLVNASLESHGTISALESTNLVLATQLELAKSNAATAVTMARDAEPRAQPVSSITAEAVVRLNEGALKAPKNPIAEFASLTVFSTSQPPTNSATPLLVEMETDAASLWTGDTAMLGFRSKVYSALVPLPNENAGQLLDRLDSAFMYPMFLSDKATNCEGFVVIVVNSTLRKRLEILPQRLRDGWASRIVANATNQVLFKPR